MKKTAKIVLCIFFLIVQCVFIVLLILKCIDRFKYFFIICFIISAFAVINILRGKSNPTYKISWLVPVLLCPVFGGLFYFIIENNIFMFGVKKRMKKAQTVCLNDAEYEIPLNAKRQSDYIFNSTGLPVFRHTTARYFSLGEEKLFSMLRELKKAKKFIFIEYFIIKNGKMWDSILKIITKKAHEGLDVRVIYDEFGCLLTLSEDYKKTLEEKGIKCCVFNPLVPVLSLILNNRDHRKICIIDGETGFLGGINLADEYINEVEKHGHWKDVSIMLKGEAVKSLTGMFLTMWNYCSGSRENVKDFIGNCKACDDGYVQPFADGPLEKESVGETVYINMISRAERYIYITTPYIMISNELSLALRSSAKSGVDVRIITPHIADKKYVHAVTRAYYSDLINDGVKIYEYMPGFIHSKTIVTDDEYAVVGSINLDYRSMYLHYESAVWLYKTTSVIDVRNDFIETLDKSERITEDTLKNTKWYIKAIRMILRVFAPFM